MFRRKVIFAPVCTIDRYMYILVPIGYIYHGKVWYGIQVFV